VYEDHLIRAAQPSDRAAILDTVGAAFAGEGHDEQEEIDLVEAVWSVHAAVKDLDLVAVRDGQIVGHVLGSWGRLTRRPVVGVAPLAVRPEHQGTGIGTALMQEIITRGDFAHHPMLVLLGDPGYYERFGFEPAASWGVWYSPAGKGSPHFMVRRMASFLECPGGEYFYAWEL
jgi:putative acetyltransferase